MNLDLAKLQYFVVAAKTENFQEAARLLRLSPAAVSKAIKSLEDEFSRAFFVRSGRKVSLTDAGQEFAQEAQNILAEVDKRLYRRDVAATAEKQLRLGSFEVFTTYFLGELLASEKFAVDVKVFELTPGHLEEALINNSVDVGITYVPVPRPQLDFLRVGSIQMGIFAGQSTKFDQLSFIDWPFAVPITPVVGAATRIAGLDGWPEDIVIRKRSFEVTLMESGLELVRRGMAVMYMPVFIAKLHNKMAAPSFRLKALPKPSKVRNDSQDVYLVKRKSSDENSDIRRIARCLRRVCRS